MRFYKFRAVGSDLATDVALEGLLKSYAVFSSRRNFNDVFDSKVLIERPTPEQIEGLLQSPTVDHIAATMSKWVSTGNYTPNGLAALTDLETGFNQLIDSYPIYCLGSSDDNLLLWAHYAASHTGFCIEFEFPDDQPTKVSYRERLASIPLLNFIKQLGFGVADPELGKRIHEALHVKLNCWEREVEYRWIAGNEMGQIPKVSKFMTMPYDPKWVKAVIFGCRTSSEVKAYIQSKVPFSTEFKQAVEKKDRLEVVCFKG